RGDVETARLRGNLHDGVDATEHVRRDAVILCPEEIDGLLWVCEVVEALRALVEFDCDKAGFRWQMRAKVLEIGVVVERHMPPRLGGIGGLRLVASADGEDEVRTECMGGAPPRAHVLALLRAEDPNAAEAPAHQCPRSPKA